MDDLVVPRNFDRSTAVRFQSVDFDNFFVKSSPMARSIQEARRYKPH